MSKTVYVAKVDAELELNGRIVEIRRGRTQITEDHEILEKYPEMFRKAGVKRGFETARNPHGEV